MNKRKLKLGVYELIKNPDQRDKIILKYAQNEAEPDNFNYHALYDIGTYIQSKCSFVKKICPNQQIEDQFQTQSQYYLQKTGKNKTPNSTLQGQDCVVVCKFKNSKEGWLLKLVKKKKDSKINQFQQKIKQQSQFEEVNVDTENNLCEQQKKMIQLMKILSELQKIGYIHYI